jgi:excisionase family DNA binding protein
MVPPMSQSSAASPVPPAPSEWLTTEQVMERLLEDPALSRLAATCVLPAVRCGDEWRFRRADLDQWIERQRRLQSDMRSRSTSRRD